VREEVRKAFLEGLSSMPTVEPEGRGGTISKRNFGDLTERGEPCHNVLPDGGVEVVAIAQIPRVVPTIHTAEPGSPGGRSVGVKLGEEFGHESRVLGWEGNDAKPPKSFWGADVIPGNLALAAMTSFFTSPEECATPFVNGLHNTDGEEPSGHGMGEHRGEHRVDKDQAAANGEATATPSRETHVAFGHDGGEVSEAHFVGGEWETKIGLREGGDLAPKGSSHGGGDGSVDFNGNKGALVEVDG
jgi:hypothetical protein